jgi:[acyl-carrier-protein] S-malonyltransferase
MTYAVLFPGQGSQFVGMAADVRAEMPDLIFEASELLGWDLGGLIADGPESELTATDRAQPALYVTSFGLWREFADAVHDGPVAAAGHSLGEYTALAAAEAMSFSDGLALVAARGAAMAEASASTNSAMAAVIGVDEDVVDDIAARRRADGGALHVANINAPGQIVVSGGTEDIAWLVDNARSLGVRRAIPLNVAAGFHSPFMEGARRRLTAVLDDMTFSTPRFSVVANATASIMEDPASSLADQLTAPVRFSETLLTMAAAGVDTFVHVGPGDVTAGLARRTVPAARVMVVSTLLEARTVAEELSVQ